MKIVASSFCADFLRGREPANEYRLDHRDESLVLTAVGYYELYHGAVKENRDPALLDDELPWVERLDYDRAHALEGTRIRQELEERGQRIQHPDTMIAGAARSLGVPVVTADGGFERIDGLNVENHRKLY